MSSRVLLGMSGGVDSTVSAILLKEQGYDVRGVYMKLHDNEEYHKQNYEKAKRVGEYLGIEVDFLDLSDEFKKDVYDYFVDSYKRGITPNPCVVCNRTIKFGKMIEFANSLGIDRVATGHYLKTDGRYIYMAKDKNKDQSYFLAMVEPKAVESMLFPLSDMTKSEVFEIAKSIDILEDIATQKESSEICFVEGDYTDVLKRHTQVDIEGEVVDEDGNIVGTHKGFMHYTIGKRRGFTVRGAHEPHFVLALEPQNNRIVVGKRDKLEVNRFRVGRYNLFDDLKEFKADIKVRYRTKAVSGRVKLYEDGGVVELDEPVFGLASGQFAVFYDGDRLLGGAVIEGAINEKV